MAPSAMERVQNRDLQSKVVAPSTKEFDDYQPVRAQAQSDLDRSMETLNQSMEAEMQRVEECPDQHLFGEGTVETEKMRGDENIANIRGIVDMQDQVYRSIMSKVKETEEAPETRRYEKTRSESQGNYVEPYQVEEGDTVRVKNACNVANQISRAQIKKDLHQRRRQVLAADEAKFIDSLREKHKLIDENVARSQHARVEKQMERTVIAQQKRNEQQKMMKEIQRSQDHQFELLQLKHHPSGRKLPALSHSASASQAPAAPAGEPVKLNRHMSEPIFRDISSSHKLYSTTLERWRTFEADNERRTDAYWRKMLQGESRKQALAPSKPESKLHLFKNAAKTITTIRSFMKKATGSFAAPGAGEAYSDDEDTLQAVDTTHLSELSFEMHSGRQASVSNDGGNDLRQNYLRRLDSVKSFKQDLERQAIEKAERDAIKLAEKQRLGREEQMKKAAKAGDYCKEWEKRSEASSQRRQELAIQNDGACFVKMTAAQQRLEDMEAAQAQERCAIADSRSQVLMSVKAASDKRLDDSVKSFKAKQDDKDERGNELLNNRLQSQYKRAQNSHMDLVMQKHAQKQQNELAFRKQTEQEIKHKQERQANAMRRVEKRPREASQRDQKQAMDRMRVVRSDKGRDNPDRAPPAELRLPPDLALPPELSLSPKARGGRTPTFALNEQESPGAASQQTFGGSRGSPIAMDMLEEEEMISVISRRQKDFQRQSVSTKSGRPAGHTPSSLLSASGGMGSDAKLGASAGSSSRRSSNDSDNEDEASEGESQFLEDLRSKSSKWLTQMRKAQ